MAYDALAESIAVIEHGLPIAPPRLSRRRRFAALAVDVDRDVACTLFSVRAPGGFRQETHSFARRGGGWVLVGGGGSGQDEDGLADRPSTGQLGATLVSRGSGSVLREGRLMPWGARYVRHAELLVSQDVHDVLVAGDRVLRAPRYGRLVVVWSTRRPPAIVARDREGRPVGDLQLSAPG